MDEIIKGLQFIAKTIDSLKINSSQNSTKNENFLENKLIDQNRELISSLKKSNSDKMELKLVNQKHEEEIWYLRNHSKKEFNTLSDQDREKVKTRFLF